MKSLRVPGLLGKAKQVRRGPAGAQAWQLPRSVQLAESASTKGGRSAMSALKSPTTRAESPPWAWASPKIADKAPEIR